MTRRMLVIGNSHVAAVREACAADPVAGHRVEFLAAPGDLMHGLAIGGGVAEAATPELAAALDRLGMRRRLPLDAFDAVLIVGCEISVFRLVAAAAQLTACAMPSFQRRVANGKQLVSLPCLTRMAGVFAAEALGGRVLAAIRACSEVPVLISPQPRPNTAILTRGERFPAFRRAVGTGDAEVLSSVFAAGCDAALTGARVLHQPRETVEAGLCTAPGWMTGATRLAVPGAGHEPDDILHANRRYGGLILRQVEEALSQMQAPAEA